MLRITVKLISLAALLMFLAACDAENGNHNNNDNGERTRLVPVETIQITTGSFDDFIRISGTVEALDDAVISSESSGRIMNIVERGQLVQRGDVVAKMDDRLIRAAYDAALTGYDLAKDTYNRLAVLYADSIISTQEYNSIRAQRDQAKAQLDMAAKQLQDATITAPFSGRVEERFVRAGELINPGMPVVRIVNTSKVRVKAGVPERFSREIRERTPVLLNFRDGGSLTMESRITFAGNVIDRDTRTYDIEIELDNPRDLIKPEMVVDIQAKRRTIQDAVIIPRTAIIRDEDGNSVFVSAMENGRKVARLVSVETGTASGAIVEVLSGLSEGDEVVVTGISNLSAGDRLNILRTWDSIQRAREIQLGGSTVQM